MIYNHHKLAPVLLGIHLVALPMYPRIPLYVMLMIALFTVWSILMVTQRVKQPGRLLRFALAVAVITSLMLSYGTIFGQLPGTAMLLMLCFLKLFEMKHKRDVIIVIFMSYFLVASHFFHSQSPWMAVYVFIIVIYLTSLLIIFSDRLESNDFRLRMRVSARMILQALPLMLILFVLFPRIPGPLWGLPETAQSARTGISEEMSPGSINNLIGSGAVAFRVQFDGAAPGHADLYWRGLVLSHYDGRTWRRDDAPAHTRPDVIYQEQQADLHRYTVTLEPHDQKWLYTLEHMIAYEDSFRVSRELQVLDNEKISNVVIYSMQSNLRAVNRGLFEPERDKNLRLPSGLNQKTIAFASQLKREVGGDDARLVQRVLDYFGKQAFVYTLSPPLLGNDAMDDFLFDTQSGFCEHYASAFVYLMRAAGVPARVVVGYQGGMLNPVDDYLIVRQSDAHAWTEVWLETRGWVRVDPTAAVSPNRIELGIQGTGVERALLPSILISSNAFLMKSRYLWDSFHNSWNQWVVGFNQKKQKELFNRLGIKDVTLGTLVIWLVIVMSLSGGLIAFWVFRRASNASADSARYYYDKFCSKLEKAGIKKTPYEGPREFLGRAAGLLPGIKDELASITGYYLSIRYGCDDSKALKKQFIRSVKQFRPGKMYKKSVN